MGLHAAEARFFGSVSFIVFLWVSAASSSLAICVWQYVRGAVSCSCVWLAHGLSVCARLKCVLLSAAFVGCCLDACVLSRGTVLLLRDAQAALLACPAAGGFQRWF